MREKIQKEVSQTPWEAFDRKLHTLRLIMSSVIVFLLFCGVGLIVLLTQNMQKKVLTGKPTIVLVNEDQAESFNGTNYNFGQSFVNLVSNDNKYNWQVVSRAVADRAYSDGSVQAVIYLPQNFTHNILTLEAIDPQKAQVDYKVLSSQSELTNRLLQDKIVNVLYDFNTSIVKMYYASVAGNVASAQTNMAGVVNSQDAILANLKNNIYGPFQSTNEGYSSVISVSNGLKAQNESWIQAQNSFTNSVTSMLNSDSTTFNGTLPTLSNYFTTQKQIIDLNRINSNQGIRNQANSDKTNDYNQYTTAYNGAVQSLHLFDNLDSSGTETGQYANLQGKIVSYNDIIKSVKDDITGQRDSLTEKQTTLLGLEKSLYSEFFAQDLTPTAGNINFSQFETNDNARTALAALLSKSFGKTDNITGTAYPDTIRALLQKVSVDKSQYEPLFSAMVTNGTLTVAQKAQYEAQLDVLKNYVTDFKLATGSVNFNDVPSTNTTDQKMTKQLTVTVPAGTQYKLTFSTGSGLTDSNVTLDPKNPPTGGGIDVTNPQSIVLDNRGATSTSPATSMATSSTSSTSTTSSSSTATAGSPVASSGTSQTYTITYLIDLGQASSGTVTFDWGTGSDQHSSVDTFGLMPANGISEYVGGSKFSAISDLLSNINNASSLIAFLYGAPSASYQDLQGITDFQASADAKSMYIMYGNMDQKEIASRLSANDVAQFATMGKNNIDDVVSTLTSLASMLSGLTTDQSTLSENLPNDYFKQSLADLKTWYDQTMTALKTQYDAWAVNPTTLIQEKPWTEYDPNVTALYYDKADGESLYSNISSMVASSAEQAQDTAASAQIIQSNSAEFTQMVDTVSQTQNSAQTVIDNTGSLLASGTGDLKNSQNYYSNFETVLSNTRTTGVNPNHIFDFFSKPLLTKDISPKLTMLPQNFDWRWVILFIMGILIGVLGKTWIRRKPKQNER